jgi:hypothetical protein
MIEVAAKPERSVDPAGASVDVFSLPVDELNLLELLRCLSASRFTHGLSAYRLMLKKETHQCRKS